MSVTLKTFVDMYFEDKKSELKERSVRNKRYMIESHIVPYFGTRKMNEIIPSDIIKWQNIMMEKDFALHLLKNDTKPIGSFV